MGTQINAPIPIQTTGKVCISIQPFVPKIAGTPHVSARMQNYWVDGSAGVAAWVDWFSQQPIDGYNVFYTPASYAQVEGGKPLGMYTGRTAENAVSHSSIYVDIDAKDQPNKRDLGGEPDVDICLYNLSRFIESSGMPMPSSVILSGGGIHAYWMFQQSMANAEYLAASNALDGMCKHYGLANDGSTMHDCARLMRLPGFINPKYASKPTAFQCVADPAHPMKGYFAGGAYQDIDEVVAKLTPFLGYAGRKPATSHADPASWMDSILAPAPASIKAASAFTDIAPVYTKSQWPIIQEKSCAGSGCAIIARAVTDQTSPSRELWLSTIGIARHCEDPESALVAISGDHPKHDFHRDVWTMNSLTHPPSVCETMRSGAIASGYGADPCSGCQHRGKITSPIQLGKPAPPPVVVEVAPATPDAPAKTMELRVLPWPYQRPDTGGVSVSVSTGEVDDNGTELYETHNILAEDIRLIGVAQSADNEGERVVKYEFQYMHKMQGMQTFAFGPTDYVGSKIDKMCQVMASHYIDTANSGNPMWRQNVSKFIAALVKQHTDGAKVTETVGRFGPTHEGDKTFVLGRTRYHPDGRKTPVILTTQAERFAHSMPAPAVTDSELSQRARTITEWNAHLTDTIGNSYSYGVDQFMLMSGFGAALAPYITPSRVRGGLVVVHSNASGSGKSTMAERATHIFTKGDGAFVTPNTTMMSFLEQRVQVTNCLPIVWDEMAKENDKGASDLSALALCSTDRKQRERKGETGGGTWQSWLYATMNPNPHALIGSLGLSTDGALFRVLALKAEKARFGTGENLVAAQRRAAKFEAWCQDNGGHVGSAWVEHFLPRVEELKEAYVRWMDKIQVAAPQLFTGSGERYALAIAATTMAACEAAGHAGLHPFSTEAVFAYVVEALVNSLGGAHENTVADDELVAEVIRTSLDVTLTKSDTNSMFDRKPSATVAIRVELKGQTPVLLSISRRYVKEWATQNKVDPKRVEEAFGAVRGAEMRKRVRLTQGTDISTANVWCIQIPIDTETEMGGLIGVQLTKEARQ